jgi:hypothetical protein
MDGSMDEWKDDAQSPMDSSLDGGKCWEWREGACHVTLPVRVLEYLAILPVPDPNGPRPEDGSTRRQTAAS